ncbi:helix-hairpin-helix domain-containing protein [Nicoliella spurrieriana]|uniref:Helix-hairpin-helix domain-containing protein n=1 Tax=Nicoliella spurrieriana TaxID=2925830 RepID=A0A976RRI2_9LACO|nr:helix-hairpin-helix domain-containing protein [Nicoliella spurrieriana]UQS86468.1 helix-hairpin-helix domain-containing protein [Nicoliella spurrieriana]
MNRMKELIDSYRYYIIGGCGIVVVILIIFLLVGNGDNKTPETNQFESSFNSGIENSNSTNTESTSVVSVSSSASSDGKLVVDIKGAVKHPGIYKVDVDTRVSNLVDLAGGFSKSADHKNVNLAQRLNDQQVIYIPIKGEVKGNRHLNQSMDSNISNGQSQLDSSSNSGDNNGKININTADKEQLQTINGIGEKKAENIISYRQEKGNFKSIDDIKNTDGIGDKMFENIKNSITV